MDEAKLDRLRLDERARLASIAAGVDTVRGLPDPVDRLLSETVRPQRSQDRKTQRARSA